MNYRIAPLAPTPAGLDGLSERLVTSHYENNYGGAVRRLNAITREISKLDVAATAGQKYEVMSGQGNPRSRPVGACRP